MNAAITYIDNINVKHHCINMIHSQKVAEGSFVDIMRTTMYLKL